MYYFDRAVEHTKPLFQMDIKRPCTGLFSQGVAIGAAEGPQPTDTRASCDCKIFSQMQEKTLNLFVMTFLNSQVLTSFSENCPGYAFHPPGHPG